ncbi:hypothetical protein ACUW9Z_000001, partial [Aerococcus sp. 150760007-1]
KKDDPDSLSGSSFVGSVTLFFYLFSLTVGFQISAFSFFCPMTITKMMTHM